MSVTDALEAHPRAKTRLGRPRLRFTREVLGMIPVWVELGARATDIAEALGTTENSLRVTCSQYNISLHPTHTKLRGALSSPQWGVIQGEAVRRGISVWELVTLVVSSVADNNLFSAVLDGR